MVLGGHHLGSEVDAAITCRFRPNEASTPIKVLSGENPGELVRQFLVHAKEVPDLAETHANVPGRNIGKLPDMAEQLAHKGLAEAHDLGVGFTFGIEVRASLATTHGQGGQGVFEDLLKSQEFQNAEVDGRVEAQTALVGTDGAVHLYPEAPVYKDFAGVVLPRNPEHDHPVRFHQSFQYLGATIFRMKVQKRFDGPKYFSCGLMKLPLVRVPALYKNHDFVHKSPLSYRTPLT